MEHRTEQSLKDYTSFKVGGKAKDFYIPFTVEEVQELVQELYRASRPYLILGNGSNLLVSDEGVEEAVILLKDNLSSCSIKVQEDGRGLLEAEAGCTLKEMAEVAMEAGYTGFEPLSGIPGTLGGAVKMNAGAYGGEIKDFFYQGLLLNEKGELQKKELFEMDFSYRHSCLSENDICLKASFLLEKGNPAEIREKMQDYQRRREEKQPLDMPSAGSTFKRPEGDYASRLIEVSGLRGFQMGRA
ncbi:MAG: UDP-N-acetylmuramate dehydrogenase, partial [Oribacterium parvum]|nr:UDP-N-acetylmuramate dehydrogenase [Oribacterium parvum]